MATVSGRVIFDRNRSATINAGDTGLVGVPVVLQDIVSSVGLVILTDASGNYSFASVPNGTYRVVEAYGTSGGTPTPGNFALAVVIPVPTGADPPISFATSPPTGANHLDSVTPNTLNVTISGANVINQNFLDGPVIYTPIGSLLDPCVTVSPINLITAADNGTIGSFPPGTAANTSPPVAPYPGVVPGFTYSLSGPGDGQYLIKNMLNNAPAITNGFWWRVTDHSVGDETGRFMALGGSNPGAAFFQQVVTVTPNTEYLFACWILNLIKQTSGFAPPALGVKVLDQNNNVIYNKTLGNAIPANPNAPQWKQVGVVINSGANTQITVEFISQGPSGVGNDFAIDDITLNELTIPVFVPVKSGSQKLASIGDTVTYTITLTNTCTSTLTGVTFQDTIPQGLSFATGSVVVDGTAQAGFNPQTGFVVPSIKGGAVATITFDVVVDTVPTPNPTMNVAVMNYIYTPLGGSTTLPNNQNSNSVPLVITSGDFAYLDSAKASSLDYADIGDTITYTINFTNIGNATANNVVITDTVPDGTTYVNASLSANVAFTGDPTTTINLTGPVAVGDSVTLTYQVVVDAIPFVNPIPNTANMAYEYISDPSLPPVLGSNDTNTTNTQVNHADLSPADKEVSQIYAVVGDTLTYTIIFANTGTTTANGVVIIDTVPNGTTYVAGSLTTDVAFTGDPTTTINLTDGIAAGQTVTLTFDVVINTIPAPNPIENTAHIVYNYLVNPASVPVSGSIDTNPVDTQVNQANLSLAVKTVDKSYANVGDTITYTISFTNTGNADADVVVIVDTLPSGTTYVSGSTSANVPFTGDPTTVITLTNSVVVGQSVTVTFKVVVNTLPNPNPILNGAHIGYSYTADPNLPPIPGNTDTTIATTQVNHADLAPATKVASKTNADVGDTLTYTIVFANTGNVPATDVVITDTIPSGTTYVGGSTSANVAFTGDPTTAIILTNPVGAGQTVTVTFSVVVNTIPNPNPIPNGAGIAYNYSVDPSLPAVPGSTNSNITNTMINHADLSPAVKVADKGYADLGDTITYTIAFINTGNTTANGVVITDTVPNGAMYVPGSTTANVAFTGDPTTTISLTGPVGVGQSVTITFKVVVTTDPNPNPMANQAHVAYNYSVDPSLPPVQAGVPTDVANTQVNHADLSPINKTVNKVNTSIGDTVTYTIAFANTGNTTATGIVITDTVPSGTTYVPGSTTANVAFTGDPTTTISLTGPVGAGQTVTVTFSVVVNTVPTPNPIANDAHVAYSYVVDPRLPATIKNLDSNTVNTQVNYANLGPATKTADKGLANVGDTITYTIVFTNTGNTTTSGIVIQDALPNGTSYIAGSISANVAVTGDPTTAIHITNPVATGLTVTVTFQVSVVTLPVPNPISNQATIDYNYIGDPSLPPIHNSTTTNQADTQVSHADLSPANKVVDKGYANIGDTITYTINFTNTGNIPADHVVITDTVPNGTAYVSGSTSANVPFTGDPTTVISLNNPIAPGQSVTLTFKVVVNTMPIPNPIPNSASIAYDYTTDPSLPPVPGNTNSNDAKTQVNHAELAPASKSADKVNADVGDTITYTVAFTNTGNVPASGVIVLDTVPNGTTYIAGSASANVPFTGDLTTAITLANPVAAGQSVILTYSVQVDTIPTPNPIPNGANITYNYSVDPSLPPVPGNTNSNIATTKINHADLSPATKSADKGYADLGDTITYTIAFINTGNTTASDIVLTDTVPNGTTYVSGSISANVPFTGDPTTAISLTGPVGAGQSVTMTFKVVVNTIPIPNPIPNEASIAYNYIADPSLPPVQEKIPTTIATTQINHADLGPASKVVDKANTAVGDILTYTIVFTNTGSTTASDVVILDTVPAGTTYVAGSISASVPFSGDPTTTIELINPVGIGETVTVNFGVEVTTIPTPNTIANTANVAYNYIVDPSVPPTEADTNTNLVSTLVKNPELTVTKSANSETVPVNTPFIYTITVTNTGDVPVNSVVVTDALPAGFTVLKIQLDGLVVGGDLVTGIPLGTLVVGQSHVLTVAVVIEDIVLLTHFNNVANANGTATLNPGLPPFSVSGHGTDETGINIYNPILEVVKSANKTYAIEGDRVTYSILVTNKGNMPIDNIIVSDMISNQLEFIPGSVEIDDVPVPNASILSGVNIGSLGVGESTTVTFRVRVISSVISPITNSIDAQYKYTIPGNPPVTKETTSNIYSLGVTKVSLQVVKKANKKMVMLGDTLTYTVYLTNDGKLAAQNVLFEDDLSTQVKLVKGSFTVNGQVIKCVDLSKGVLIGDIPVGQTIIISYQVVVVSSNCKCYIINVAKVKFNYTLPNGYVGTKKASSEC